MKKINSLSIILALAFVALAHAGQIAGKVTHIAAGDSISIYYKGKEWKIRLAGIDTPEIGQPYGNQAKKFTSMMVFAQTVTINTKGMDRYGRTIAEVRLKDGQNLEHELLRNGLAWRYKRYSKNKTLDALEKEARAAKLGLWSDRKPVPPWEWRK